ncbi:hypothetical protein [Shewanella sp. 10N.286.51.B7]|uniref:hypothetical protein n=1 Tax=Shewanella sp. 10N.286.51.B7 TaxID=1880836 RepID=UPI001F52D559|nr:hypothetical protein [Shewanella sp. 10N.286.51.B7]
MTATIANKVERLVVSFSINQLKMAAMAGVALKMTNVLAIDVILMLNTKPVALPNMSMPDTSIGQPLAVNAFLIPRLSFILSNIGIEIALNNPNKRQYRIR